MNDPIVDEIHRRREERAAKFNHDLDAMFADLRRSEKRSKALGVKFVSPKPRKPRVRTATLRRATAGKKSA